jgi:hypothetical protein
MSRIDRFDKLRFRQEAENCLRLEAEAIHPIDKEALLWMAEQWIQLAGTAEFEPNDAGCPAAASEEL